MKPSMTLSALLLGGAIVMGGCGGGSSSDTTTTNGSGGASSSANSGDSSSQSASGGTGYYLDSAVAGVSYTCGSETGKTDNDGKFTFEKGKGCTFEVAGIPLRQVPADELVDNAKIVENNVTVARFLQSIDTDGDLSNGIQITDEVITVLTQALKNSGIDTVPKDDTQLTGVVEDVKQQVSKFKGEVKTRADAEQHLQKTQENVIKGLLAGKTFYTPGIDGESTKILTKAVFNSTVDSVTWRWIVGPEYGNTSAVTIQGNMINIGNNQEFVKQTADYLEIIEHHQDGSTFNARWYYDEAKAREYLTSLISDSTSSQNSNDTAGQGSVK